MRVAYDQYEPLGSTLKKAVQRGFSDCREVKQCRQFFDVVSGLQTGIVESTSKVLEAALSKCAALGSPDTRLTLRAHQVLADLSNADSKILHVFVETDLNMTCGTLNLELSRMASTDDLKMLIFHRASIPCDAQSLTFRNRDLVSETQLFEYELNDDDTIKLVVPGLGGSVEWENMIFSFEDESSLDPSTAQTPPQVPSPLATVDTYSWGSLSSSDFSFEPAPVQLPQVPPSYQPPPSQVQPPTPSFTLPSKPPKKKKKKKKKEKVLVLEPEVNSFIVEEHKKALRKIHAFLWDDDVRADEEVELKNATASIQKALNHAEKRGRKTQVKELAVDPAVLADQSAKRLELATRWSGCYRSFQGLFIKEMHSLDLHVDVDDLMSIEEHYAIMRCFHDKSWEEKRAWVKTQLKVDRSSSRAKVKLFIHELFDAPVGVPLFCAYHGIQYERWVYDQVSTGDKSGLPTADRAGQGSLDASTWIHQFTARIGENLPELADSKRKTVTLPV